MDESRSAGPDPGRTPADQDQYDQHSNVDSVKPDDALHLIPVGDNEFVPVVSTNGHLAVALRPVIERFGLRVQTETDRLRQQPWADVRPAPVTSADGRRRSALVCSVPVFLMYLATIPHTSVAKTLRPVLAAYQRETRDAVGRYWLDGVAVNPRDRSPAELALMTNGPALLEALNHLQRGHHYDQLGAPESARIGRRELPAGTTRAAVVQHALVAYRRGYAALMRPLLALGAAGGLDGEQ